MVLNSERFRVCHDLISELSLRLGCDAISVGYRLAPEHPFPCSLRDAYTALRWVHQLDEYRDKRIVLCGDSAGGNLALVLALLARESRDADGREVEATLSAALSARICHLMLLYPSLYEDDDDHGVAAGDGRVLYMLPRPASAMYRQAYLGRSSEDRRRLLADWRVAPLRCPSLGALPPTTVVSAALDPLYRSNVRLVDTLRRATPAPTFVEHVHVERSVHGFLTLPKLFAASGECSSVLGRLEAAARRAVG